MTPFALPEQLEVNGSMYDIRTDFRDILNILLAFDDPDLTATEKRYVCLFLLYVNFDSIPPEAYEKAYQAAIRFIDNGIEEDGNSPRTMDWEQDAALIFPAVNKVAGFETRSAEYLHWWTFLGFFMEIKDSVYSTILNLRKKKARKKKLEPWEAEFWLANAKICKLPMKKLSTEEQAEKDRLNALFC